MCVCVSVCVWSLSDWCLAVSIWIICSHSCDLTQPCCSDLVLSLWNYPVVGGTFKSSFIFDPKAALFNPSWNARSRCSWARFTLEKQCEEEMEYYGPCHLGNLAEVEKLVPQPHNDATPGTKPSVNDHSP